MPLSEADRENIVAYLDGELDEKAAHEIETRINLDPAFRAEAEALKQAWGMLDFLPRQEASTNFTHRTMEQLVLRPKETGRMPQLGGVSWLRGAAWAAIVLVAVGVGWWLAGVIESRSGRTPIEDETLVRHLRIIEKMPLLEQIDDIEFLRSLDHPDLFGEETGSF